MIGNKTELRKFMLNQRKLVDDVKKQKWDNQIFNKVINSEYYKKANTIFIFVSFKNEVDTHRLIEYALSDNKKICVPKVKLKEREMELYKINSFNDLEVGYYNILEPIKGSPKINVEDIDLILMPGLAFDKEGGRIGYGGGYYDKFLRKSKKNKTKKIAIAYAFQVLDKVPMNENDIKIDGIITNNNIFTNKDVK